MVNSPEFLQQITEAINQKYTYVSTTVTGPLKENFRILHSTLNSMTQLCQKKGVLKTDPYRKEKQISEVTPPEDSSLGDAYAEDELAIRLSEYDAQMDFMINYVSFAPESLTLKDVKSMLGMLRLIRWNEFSSHATRPTTRTFASIVETIQKGSDSFAAGAISSSINQCAKLYQEINNQLKHLTFLKREEYKLEIREKIMSGKDFGTSIPRDLFHKEIKGMYTKSGMTQAYFAELVDEIYDEEFGESTQEARDKIFKNLEIPQKKVTTIKKSDGLKEILIEGLRTLGTGSRHMDTAMMKLRENSDMLQNRPKSFMEKFKEWVIQMSSGKQEDIIYEIEIVDPVTSVHTPKDVNFPQFNQIVEKKSKVLQGFFNKQSQAFQKMTQADEDQRFTVLDKNISETQSIYNQMEALDTFFKSEFDRFSRDQVRGIKNDILGVQNSLVSANQKKHEYIAKKEEIEQLKKLGIQS